jgi:dUTP pyrophosphatase
VKVRFKKLHPNTVVPSYAKPGDAGMDLTATDDGTWTRDPSGFAFMEYGTGLAVEIPDGYVGLIFPRSSITKVGLNLANSVGVIDSGYRGEIRFRFRVDAASVNENGVARKYAKGDRLGQLVILPYPTIEPEEVDELSDTARGTGGFGSSGQ